MSSEEKNPDWKEFFTEISPDLTKIEFLFVGEKDGKAFKDAFAIDTPATYEGIKDLLAWVNKNIDEKNNVYLDSQSESTIKENE